MNVRCQGGPWHRKHAWIEGEALAVPECRGEYRRLGLRAFWVSHDRREVLVKLGVELLIYAVLILGLGSL